MKKRFFVSLLIILVVVAGTFTWYFSTTISANDCFQYCIDNTEREATEFQAIADPRYSESYVYWVAGNGNSTKPQEIFIFREKFLGPFDFFNRYEYIASSVQSNLSAENTGVGSIQFFTYNDDNEKENEATLLLYGARNDLDVFWYECTVSVSGKEETFEGKVLLRDNIWMLRIFDLGNINESEKREVVNLKLYDDDKNLLYIY